MKQSWKYGLYGVGGALAGGGLGWANYQPGST